MKKSIITVLITFVLISIFSGMTMQTFYDKGKTTVVEYDDMTYYGEVFTNQKDVIKIDVGDDEMYALDTTLDNFSILTGIIEGLANTARKAVNAGAKVVSWFKSIGDFFKGLFGPEPAPYEGTGGGGGGIRGR